MNLNKSMKKLIYFILFLGLLGCNKQKEMNPNEIPFDIKGGLPVVKLTVNGKGAQFIVDTGAASTLIDLNRKEYFEFETYLIQEQITGIGGTQSQVFKVPYNSMKVVFRDSLLNTSFKAVDLSAITSKAGFITGVIGSDYFIKNNIIIDYKQKKLIKNELYN